MKRRTSILLDEPAYESLRARAKRHGTTVSGEIRLAVQQLLAEEENPNQAWLDLADAYKDVEWKPMPPAGSDDAKEQLARDIFRHKMGREPDW
jgi:plasmid stability protein